ncbi:MAG: aspartate kinase [Thermodesulfobacteriota bacterium]
MALIVQKFGGTSVASVERIKEIAKRVAKTREEGNDVVVVLSAMAGETTRLIDLAKEAGSPVEGGREFDVVVSTGEQVTIGLLAIALKAMGIDAVSMLGLQVPILTDSGHSSARIVKIGIANIVNVIKSGSVVVIAGFQGVDSEGNITTLGRGGSDTSAVAIAAAIEADLCEVYTDVEGVFTTDPNICPEARKIKKISYDEMLEMAGLGAKVLQTRSVEFSRKYSVPLMVRSSFSEKEGTLVTKEDEDMEKAAVAGIAYNKNEAKISVVRVPDKPGVAVELFRPLSEANINVDMIVQNISHEGFTDMTFTVPKGDYGRALKLVKETAIKLDAKEVTGSESITKISVVGAGMKSHAGVATKVFEVLSSEDINIEMISTSEIKISCVIDEAQTERAVKTLHKAFELDKEDVGEEK